jgi:hypothetical protein
MKLKAPDPNISSVSYGLRSFIAKDGIVEVDDNDESGISLLLSGGFSTLEEIIEPEIPVRKTEVEV